MKKALNPKILANIGSSPTGCSAESSDRKQIAQTLSLPAVRIVFFGLFVSIATASMISSPTVMLGQNEDPAANATFAPAYPSVPKLIRFNGTLMDGRGWPITTPVSVRFAIYTQPVGEDQPPLWQETQQISPGSKGGYTVLLGSVNPNGIPVEVFKSGEAQYLGVKVDDEPEQARVLLVSVPYALKAGDATTLNGLPASAFALAGTKIGVDASTATAPGAIPLASATVTTTGGQSGYLPQFSGAATIIDSPVYADAAGIGIGKVPDPSAALDVNGSSLLRGNTAMTPSGTAASASGVNSHSFALSAGAWNSSLGKAVSPFLEFQSEPVGNNTASPGASLHVLSSNGVAGPTETGLSIAPNGTINFAPGQAFPGTGPGTIRGVTAGTDLTGGGTSGIVTLNLDTTKVPLLTANNAFLGSGSFAGNLGIGSSPSGTNYTPLALSSSSTFGTWLSLSNNSPSGHTWNILSAGSANSEGAGNLGITDLTGKSTIFLEGNVKANSGSFTASTAVSPAAIATNSALNGIGVEGNSTGLDGTGVVGKASASNCGSLELCDAVGVLGTASVDSSVVGVAVEGSAPGQNNFAGLFQGNVLVEGPVSGAVGPFFGDAAVFQVDQAPPNGNGIDAAAITSGGSQSVASLLLANTGSGGLRLRTGVGTGTAYLASSGPLEFVTADTGTPSFPSAPALSIDTSGNVSVRGALSAGIKFFKIDHPLDPANKYLVHSSIESSEMVNIYSGNVTTDELGIAVVHLPDWFEAENGDFRYQLTVMGERFAQAIVSKKIQNHEFTVSTNATHVEVSWQVTGVRQDAYAKTHPLVVEQAKPADQRGAYIHSEIFGQPEEKKTSTRSVDTSFTSAAPKRPVR